MIWGRDGQAGPGTSPCRSSSACVFGRIHSCPACGAVDVLLLSELSFSSSPLLSPFIQTLVDDSACCYLSQPGSMARQAPSRPVMDVFADKARILQVRRRRISDRCSGQQRNKERRAGIATQTRDSLGRRSMLKRTSSPTSNRAARMDVRFKKETHHDQARPETICLDSISYIEVTVVVGFEHQESSDTGERTHELAAETARHPRRS